MTKRTWSESSAKARIATRLSEVKTVEIKEYKRDTDLTGIKTGVAYRVDGVHLYLDIINIKELLETTAYDGETAQKRAFRFLNNHYRAVRNILQDVDAIQVDFHNQRLHAVFAKPYGDEAARVHKAVATAQLIRDVLAKIGENEDDPLPAAKTRVGIDTGKALAVNNGRRSNREPLFLGNPANEAAKRAGHDLTVEGIFITNAARAAVGWDQVLQDRTTELTEAQVEKSQEKAALTPTVDSVVKQWEEDLEQHPIGKFEFSRHTPPYKTLDLETLNPADSRRQEAVSIYADIDNFTRYVAERIDDDDDAIDVVKTLHVLRSELDAVLHDDFAGKKVRFIGDCIHGILVEGTAPTTDEAETAKNAMLCAAAMRSSFAVALGELQAEGIDTGDLGLGIGLEHGFTAVTRLGIKGEKIRCCLSRSVLRSEDEQRRCNGRETAIGANADRHAPQQFRSLFGTGRKRADFDYAAAEEALNPKEETKKSSSSSSLLKPAVAAGAGFNFKAEAAPSRNLTGFS
ncbi:adenylate/guanylate cyclase domain-containing protein [Mitsuaria sp. 7]|uniref:adenylate/guanylate cyclase domain-containing protein n=1 Tax=Mitsuaria sp. 7 TaxID=1658665 RepID=UPI0007DD9F7C|nr:adenylate/guanylate cyclase domain-containing protein [Mitsuaria sp. 7]ANH69636.1 transcriptional regulator [Mitsuaria sp. 7]